MLFLALHFRLRVRQSPASMTRAAVSSGKEPKTDHSMILYINWDGFAWYYYAIANQGEISGTPVINELAREGVFFDAAYSGIPSITNPMQTSLLTGAWPKATGNCYQSLDRASGQIIKTGRLNQAENLAEAVERQGFKAVSIHQFILENKGTYPKNPDNTYISLGNHADYVVRFDEAIRFIKSREKAPGSSELPKLLAIYMDDLDGIGHNSWYTYGVPAVKTEDERIKSILKRLREMDSKLGELIHACKETGIYDSITFLLATDHGMTPYGIQTDKEDGYGRSKLPDLIEALRKTRYQVEVLKEGRTPGKNTDIALAPTGLQVQLFFLKSSFDYDEEKIRMALGSEKYIGEILGKEELIARGAAEDFADMLISAQPPYCLKDDNKLHRAGGQHDSLDESSQHIFAMMWGKGIVKDLRYDEKVEIIDFIPTLCSASGIEAPRNATGRVLLEVLESPE